MTDVPGSLLAFQQRFTDEAACAAYLAAVRWPHGFVCPRCGHTKAWLLQTKTWTYECASCHKQTSVTAGTILHASKLSLTVWFWAAYLMASHSNGISALQLRHQLALGSYKTAWFLCAKLRASEVRWRTMFERFPVGILLCDADQRYMAANPAFQRMVGFSEPELVGLSPLDITHEEDRPATEHTLAELRAGVRHSVEKEKRFRRKHGRIVWAMLSTFCVPETRPVSAFYPAIVVDITKRKQAEEALRESELELARASRLTMMGQLAASIAHELKQPLTAAIANGTTCQHWLSEGVLDLAKARSAAQRMTVAARRRASEVMDRIRALLNKAPVERVKVVVNDLLRETLAIIETELRARQIGVAAELIEPSPSVMGDRVQLQQVGLNLIMNGVEAMSTVADRPRLLRIRSRSEARVGALVAVEDSGTELQPAIAKRMFDPFFTTKAGGTGMGLSICRSIIEGHGGRLWASPAPSGALMQFTLPADEGAP
jgi:PAS domain S-box-containing protein